MNRVIQGAVMVALVAMMVAGAVAQDGPPPASGAGTPPGDTAATSTSADGPPPLPISKDCQTPGVKISGDFPLPNVTRVLRTRKVFKIMTFGASSKGGKVGTEGYQQVMETVLEQAIPGIDVQIINRGVSGELARDAAERMRSEVALTKPDLILWQVGTQDALMHVPVDEFKSTIGETLDWLQRKQIDVVMVGLHYLRAMAREPHYQSVRKALRDTAEAKKVLWIGRYEAMQVIEQAKRTAGGASPNEFAITEAGYSCLSEYVTRALTTGAFARSPRRQ